MHPLPKVGCLSPPSFLVDPAVQLREGGGAGTVVLSAAYDGLKLLDRDRNRPVADDAAARFGYQQVIFDADAR